MAPSRNRKDEMIVIIDEDDVEVVEQPRNHRKRGASDACNSTVDMSLLPAGSTSAVLPAIDLLESPAAVGYPIKRKCTWNDEQTTDDDRIVVENHRKRCASDAGNPTVATGLLPASPASAVLPVVDLLESPAASGPSIKRQCAWNDDKTIRWSEPLFTVYEELDDDDDEVVEDLSDPNGPNGDIRNESSQLTDDMTLISTAHARQRRDQRNISKYDVKAVLKYGTKERTGNRWRWRYGNLVCITDDSGKLEITSYKDESQILPIKETPILMKQHKDAVDALKNDPQLCVSHTIVCVDQSGSMRESDVSGFVSRSEAAYGILARDFIAEQVYTSGEDNTVDVLSLIEMNNQGSLIYDRVPLDWNLYNRLLRRQKLARPRSHGQYGNALEKIEKVIDADLELLGNPSQDDMPNYVVVFLSDGRPSDDYHEARERREYIVDRIASKLGSKLAFTTIGLGKSSDFKALQHLVRVAEKHGASGSFDYAHLSAEILGTTMSRISTALTTTRTATLALPDIFREDGDSGDEETNLRSSKVSRKNRSYSTFSDDVTRKTFSRDLDAYVQQPFHNNNASGFKMEQRPFGVGRERLAFTFYEIDADGNELGKELVAKRSRNSMRNSQASRFNKRTCRIHCKASSLAKVFNEKISKSPHFQAEFGSMPLITFLECSVYDFTIGSAKFNILVEEKLNGRFTKYNGNNGYVLEDSGSTVTTTDGQDIYLTEFLQAFSHWTYIITDHDLLVCDLQGVLNEEGKAPFFQLTDPVICSRSTQRYGKTDVGRRGFQSFRQKHQCNEVCRRLGLPAFGAKLASKPLKDPPPVAVPSPEDNDTSNDEGRKPATKPSISLIEEEDKVEDASPNVSGDHDGSGRPKVEDGEIEEI